MPDMRTAARVAERKMDLLEARRMTDKIDTTADAIVWRRFGRNHDKPCKRPDILTCALWECQKANECRVDEIHRPRVTQILCDDAEIMRLWRECGLPEYFLGNGGTNYKLVEFSKRLRALNLIDRASND